MDVWCLIAGELKPCVVDLHGDITFEILVLENGPNLNLSLVVLVTNAEEVVIDDLLQIVLLDALQLGEELFVLLLALIVDEHNALLSLEDPREESSLPAHHFSNLKGFLAPFIPEFGHLSQMPLQHPPGVDGADELADQHRASFFQHIMRHQRVKVEVLLCEELLTHIGVRTITQHFQLVVVLQCARAHVLQ